MLRKVAKRDLPELFIFTDDYVAQGALMALALAGVRLPDDVAVVTHSNKGITPIWEKPLARLEMDPTAHARAVADAVVDYLDTGVPRDLDLGSVWKNGTTF
jgi:DNA-binding LacI/PurR family transcriptional regulator